MLAIPKVLGFVGLDWGVDDVRLLVEWARGRLKSTCWVSCGRAWNDTVGKGCVRKSFAVRVVGDGASTLLETIRADLCVEIQASPTS